MATMNEKRINSLTQQIEKKQSALIKAHLMAEKKAKIAKENNVYCETFAQWCEIRDNVTDKQFMAYFEFSTANDRVKEIEKKLESLNKQLDKENGIAQANFAKQYAAAENVKKASLIDEWAKDGINVEHHSHGFIFGETPKGKRFEIRLNFAGITERSLHCYTLRIDKKVVFTSGEFARCYMMVKNS